VAQELKEKVAVVTGGSRGIGSGIAKALARRGAKVIVNYRVDEMAAESVVRAIKSADGIAGSCQADVTDSQSVHRLLATAVERFGRLDVLVNNAGAAVARLLDDVDDAHVAELFSVNVRAVVTTTRAAVQLFGTHGGRIINVSSLNGHVASPGASIYAASKAAVDSLTRSWALELGSRNITVNAVAPGWVDTDLLASVLPREQWPRVAALTSLGRIGAPADIADVVTFLASDDARWVTGQIIGVDGGVRAF
jgi:3-oxoacyl-[acyl-carrier protein] reductase